jgi:hypothetical protein
MEANGIFTILPAFMLARRKGFGMVSQKVGS